MTMAKNSNYTISEKAQSIIKSFNPNDNWGDYRWIISALYAMKEGADSRIVNILNPDTDGFRSKISPEGVSILLAEYEGVIRYCHDKAKDAQLKIYGEGPMEVPEEVVEFYRKVIDPKPQDVTFIPYAGRCEFALSFEGRFSGYEASIIEWAFDKIMIDAFHTNMDLENIDTICPGQTGSTLYNHIVSFPPRSSEKETRQIAHYMQDLLHSGLIDGGDLCLILPTADTTSLPWISFRRYLMENKMRYNVLTISLPTVFMPTTSIKYCLMLIEKKENPYGTFFFMDADRQEFYTASIGGRGQNYMKVDSILESIKVRDERYIREIDVENNALSGRRYALSFAPSRYFVYDDLPVLGEDFEYHTLRDLVLDLEIPGMAEADFRYGQRPGRYIRTTSLYENYQSCVIDYKAITSAPIPYTAYDAYANGGYAAFTNGRIKVGQINGMFSSQGRFEENNPYSDSIIIFVDGHVAHFAPRPNGTAQQDYILRELLSDYVLEQAKKLAFGAEQKEMLARDFFNLKIAVPSIERQDEILKYDREHSKGILHFGGSMLEYGDGQEIIWNAFGDFRGVIHDYKAVLYLIHSYQKGFFDSYTLEDYPNVYLETYIEKNSTALPKYEKELFRVFANSIHELRRANAQFQDFIRHLSLLNKEWYSEYYARLFDDLLSWITDLDGKAAGIYTQPYELTKLVSSISGYDGEGTLYNPFAGTASYGTELAGKGEYVAQEISPAVWALGIMRLEANRLDPSSFLCEDSIRQWRGSTGPDMVAQVFDCIVSTPPFALRAKEAGNPREYGVFSIGDDVFIKNSLLSLAPAGVAIGVFSQGVTSRGGESLVLRQRFVDADRLDKVISLPAGIFKGTNVPTIVLKFSNIKKNPGFVQFVNGSSFYEKSKGRTRLLVDELHRAIQSSNSEFVKMVSLEEIRDKEYNLLPVKYFEKKPVVPEGFKEIHFSDLVDVVNGQRCSSNGQKGKAISISSLSESPFDYLLNIAALPDETITNNFRKISSPVLLVSKIRSLKPTFVEASEALPVYINPSILALRIKDPSKISLPCLVLALSNASINHNGAVIPSINQATILGISLIIPVDITLQEAFFRNAENAYKMAKVKEFGLEEMLSSQKKEFLLVLRNRKHDISTYVGDIRNRIQGLYKFLKANEIDQMIYSARQNTTVGENLETIIQKLNLMGQYLGHIADENIFGIPKKVDLVELINGIKGGQNYVVRRVIDVASLPDSYLEDDIEGTDNNNHAFVSVAPMDLNRVFLNITSNAAKHGFVDIAAQDYCIEVSLSYDSNDAMYVIEFRNNGKPMPEGMDADRYGRQGEKAGPTQGNGEGGAIVKQTIEHYGGRFDVVNNPGAYYPVTIILKLPRYEGE